MNYVKYSIWVIVCLLFIWPHNVLGASGPGISVSPSIIRLDLRTDNPDVSQSYKNLSTTDPITIDFSSEDFNGISDTGKLNFLTPKDASNYRYGLSSWIHFSPDSLALNPGEETMIMIHIDKQKLPVGGHYASI